jgi:hypothetical protein
MGSRPAQERIQTPNVLWPCQAGTSAIYISKWACGATATELRGERAGWLRHERGEIAPAGSDPASQFRSHRPVQIPPPGADPTGRFRSHRPVQIPPAGSDPTARFRSRRPVQIPPALTFHSRTEPSMDALYISAAVGHRTAVTQSWWPSIVTCGCEPQLGAQSGA